MWLPVPEGASSDFGEGSNLVELRAVMVGVRSHKKLPCLSQEKYIEPGRSSTVGPERHGIVVLTYY